VADGQRVSPGHPTIAPGPGAGCGPLACGGPAHGPPSAFGQPTPVRFLPPSRQASAAPHMGGETRAERRRASPRGRGSD
jgi:hypothetical protein